jgi:GTPase SAR1 family protein
MLGNLNDDSSVTAPLLRDITSVDFDFILKILIVGDSVSGKSQLFHRSLSASFSPSLSSPIFIDSLMKLSTPIMIQPNLWNIVIGILKQIKTVVKFKYGIVLLQLRKLS